MMKYFYLLYLCVSLPLSLAAQSDTSATEPEEYPNKIKVGFLLQGQALYTQDRPLNPALDNNRQWATQFQLWRANLLMSGNISERTSFFLQTTVSQPLGQVDTAGRKNIQDPLFLLLDAQVEHQFNENLFLYAGMQLVGINRQNLQAPATLMGLDFGWYQYPHLFADRDIYPLQNNFGRDIGVSVRGYAFNERLEFRAGVMRGGTTTRYAPLRGLARLNFNFLDTEKEHYYTGNSLGEQSILALGVGADVQGSYTNFGADLFLDTPLSDGLAITWSNNFMRLSGGNSDAADSFTPRLPDRDIYFSELGVLLRNLNLQPYVKYEGQQYRITEKQYLSNPIIQRIQSPATPENLDRYNTLNTESRWGVGLNYYPDGYNCNIKLQYEQIRYGRTGTSGEAETNTGGEFKLQLTYFMF